MAVAAPMGHAAGGFIWFQPGVCAAATQVILPGWDVTAFIDAVAACDNIVLEDENRTAAHLRRPALILATEIGLDTRKRLPRRHPTGHTECAIFTAPGAEAAIGEIGELCFPNHIGDRNSGILPHRRRLGLDR